MSTPGQHLSEEPQEERGAPGSPDTGADEPSGGPADRPSGPYKGDETVPTYSDPDNPGFDTKMTNQPPSGTEPAIPPYEGRKTEADVNEGSATKTGGATAPVADPNYKSPAPSETARGATASPADEQPASRGSETDRDDDRVGPAHASGVERGEDKL